MPVWRWQVPQSRGDEGGNSKEKYAETVVVMDIPRGVRCDVCWGGTLWVVVLGGRSERGGGYTGVVKRRGGREGVNVKTKWNWFHWLVWLWVDVGWGRKGGGWETSGVELKKKMARRIIKPKEVQRRRQRAAGGGCDWSHSTEKLDGWRTTVRVTSTTTKTGGPKNHRGRGGGTGGGFPRDAALGSPVWAGG